MRAKLSNRVRRQRLYKPQDVERFLAEAGVSVEKYREAAASDEVRERMRATTARLEAISRQAEASRSDANAPPRDPILLVNGKYLVQGSLAGGIRNTLQVANRLIRKELEKRRQACAGTIRGRAGGTVLLVADSYRTARNDNLLPLLHGDDLRGRRMEGDPILGQQISETVE